jgi:hypothetical protein
MSLASRHLKQVMTYWAPSSGTDINGKPTSSAAVQVACRWEDRTEQLKSKSGEDVISKTRVFVDGAVDIDSDGYVALGVVVGADPSILDNAYEIQAIGSMPDLRAVKQLKVLYL